MMEEMALSKSEMKKLLVDMGVIMKPEEVRILVDAFDHDGDGRITMTEFLNFIGPKKEKRSGIMSTLQQRCHWQTTCPKTGMPNAFSVSALAKSKGKAFVDSNGRERSGGSVISVTGKTSVRRERDVYHMMLECEKDAAKSVF